VSAATIDAAKGVVQAAGSVITQYPESLLKLRQLLHAQALRQIASKDLRQIIPKTTPKDAERTLLKGSTTVSTFRSSEKAIDAPKTKF
jgi:hypothetical protein